MRFSNYRRKLRKLVADQRSQRARDSRWAGFTLVEMIVTLVLIVLFMVGVVAIVSQGFTFFGTYSNVAALNRQGNNTLDRIEVLVLGCSEIIDAETNTATFKYKADIDADGTEETVTITSILDEITVIVDGSSSAINDSLVQGTLVFTYYSNYSHTTTVSTDYDASVVALKVEFTLQSATSGKEMQRSYSRSINLKLDPDDREAG